MNKLLFNELSNANVSVHWAQMQLREAQDKSNNLKRDFLQDLYNDVVEENSFRSLLWEYAVEENYGMDVDFYDMQTAGIITWIKKYARDVYCINLSGIYLLESGF